MNITGVLLGTRCALLSDVCIQTTKGVNMEKEVINGFVQQMSDILKNAEDFTVSQMPEVCKEILKYNFLEAVFYVTVGALILVLSYFVAKIINDQHKKDLHGDWQWMHFGTIGLIVVGILFLTINGLDIVKIELAPRLYLIEYFAQLASHK